jgi:hypothetical protein
MPAFGQPTRRTRNDGFPFTLRLRLIRNFPIDFVLVLVFEISG